jgi:hypothetical protein
MLLFLSERVKRLIYSRWIRRNAGRFEVTATLCINFVYEGRILHRANPSMQSFRFQLISDLRVRASPTVSRSHGLCQSASVTGTDTIQALQLESWAGAQPQILVVLLLLKPGQFQSRPRAQGPLLSWRLRRRGRAPDRGRRDRRSLGSCGTAGFWSLRPR